MKEKDTKKPKKKKNKPTTKELFKIYYRLSQTWQHMSTTPATWRLGREDGETAACLDFKERLKLVWEAFQDSISK